MSTCSPESRKPTTLPPAKSVATSTPEPPLSLATPGTAVTAAATACARSSCRIPGSLDPMFGRLLRGFHLDVVDLDVDFDHVKSGHALDLADHIATHRFGDLHDALAVPGDEVQIDGRFALAHLDRDTLTGGLGAARNQGP